MVRLLHRIDDEVRRNLRGEAIDSENSLVLADALESHGHTPVARELVEHRRELALPPVSDWGKIAKRSKLRKWRIVRAEIVDALRNLDEPAKRLRRQKKIYRWHRRAGEKKIEAKSLSAKYASDKRLGAIGDPHWGKEKAISGGGPVLRTAANTYRLDWSHSSSTSSSTSRANGKSASSRTGLQDESDSASQMVDTQKPNAARRS
jgi:hypothetical protein